MRIQAWLFTSSILCASAIPATALSWSVQMNCASDYYAYCSKHVAGSAGCHACMNANRTKLSSACVSALVDDGIVSKTDTTQQKPKFAATRPRAAQSVKAVAETKSAGKVRTVKIVMAKRSDARPTQKPAEASLAIDQQTFEALKNRAPYFVPAAEEETASITASEPAPH